MGNYSAQALHKLRETFLNMFWGHKDSTCYMHYCLMMCESAHLTTTSSAEVGVNFLSFASFISENLYLSVILLTFA